ncbi:MAG: hypothetical protein ACSHX0_13895 [Akkermansiaceae bacterium]
MSTRYFNYREGDRSEYLATYFFSAVGLVTPVPRQEDIGFDLVCSIADQESGRLTFNYQYLLSVKSLSTPNIELKPAKSEDGSLPHIAWLFRQELPLLLAVVDKKGQEVRVYSTLPIWFLYFENQDCGSVSLVPRISDKQGGDVGRPVKGDELHNPKGTFHYTVDLGHPIARATIADLADVDKLRSIKANIRAAVTYGRMSALHVQLGVPYFYWFAKTHPDGVLPTPAFYAKEVPDVKEAQDYVYNRIAPTLISLAMLYKSKNDTDNLGAVAKLLAAVPKSAIPEVIREHIPELNGEQDVDPNA